MPDESGPHGEPRGLVVEEWSPRHGAPVLRAMGEPEHWTARQGRAMWGPPRDGRRWARCLVLLDDGAPVAVAAAFRPRLHPSRAWVHVEVQRSRRREGIGRTALRELRRVLPPGTVLKAKVAAGSAGHAFAAREGLREIQATRLMEVSPAGAPARVAPSAVTVPAPPTDCGGFAGRVVVADGFDAVTVRAWHDFYVSGHTWDPVGDVDPELWRELLGEARHVVSLSGGDDVTGRDGTGIGAGIGSGIGSGIGVVIRDAEGWRFAGGSVHREDPDAVAVARRLIVAAVTTVAEPVVVEVDDWMTDVRHAVRALGGITVDHSLVVRRHWWTPRDGVFLDEKNSSSRTGSVALNIKDAETVRLPGEAWAEVSGVFGGPGGAGPV